MPDRSFTVNLRHQFKAVTEYENFAFDSMAEIGGRYYGADANGVYLLEGADDDGTAIDAELMTGLTDYGSQNLKRAPTMLAEYSAAGPVTLLTLTARASDETPSGLQMIERRYDLTGRRRKPGKGVESARWAFGLRNRNGARFELRALRPEIAELALEER